MEGRISGDARLAGARGSTSGWVPSGGQPLVHGAWCAWHAAFDNLVFTVHGLHTDGRITYSSHGRKNATQFRSATHTQQERRVGARAVVTCACACAEIAWLPGRKPRQPQEAPHSRTECGLLCAPVSRRPWLCLWFFQTHSFYSRKTHVNRD